MQEEAAGRAMVQRLVPRCVTVIVPVGCVVAVDAGEVRAMVKVTG